MNNKNDAPKIIIQLCLGAAVYYLFSFKYKDSLIEMLSLQVYYQILVIIVITNSYTAKFIDDIRAIIHHECKMKCSSKYRNKHYNLQKTHLLEKSKTAKLSDQAKNMLNGMADTDFELEAEIAEVAQLHEELQKIKRP